MATPRPAGPPRPTPEATARRSGGRARPPASALRRNGAADDAPDRSTRDRILDEALISFGSRGYEATSLDQVAAGLGVRKQSILYYFHAKTDLLDAVIDRSAGEMAAALEAAVARSGPGFARVEALVRAVFRLALRRPELLGLLREVSRLGPPAATRLSHSLDPLVQRATEFVEHEMACGRFRAGDARLILLSVYSTVLGVATEVEVLRAVGIEPTLRTMAARRRELVRFLRRALVPDP